MKTIKLQVHKALAEIVNHAIANRVMICGPIECLAPYWTNWNGQEEILECELNYDQVCLVSEALYLFGPDKLSTRAIMDRIIFKLALNALK